MRLGRLDLLRYGHFTNRSFEFPLDGTDLHVVFSPNEAGKSTALCAIEDLLFGIPPRSPYNFLHGYRDMRIGAWIENTESALEVVRRKGSQNTLLDADGSPSGGNERALRSFLAGADLPFFNRMFGLDRVRLEEGGRNILKANDEVGEIIFAAGAGTTGLRDALRTVGDEADGLWAPRRAQHREYYQAHDKLSAAEADLRQQRLSVSQWQELKRTFEKAQQAYAEVETRFEQVSAQRMRIGRIRRVHHYVRHKAELDDQIETLGDVAELPEDAREVFNQSQQRESSALTRIETFSGQLDAVRKAMEGLTYDEMLVSRADDVYQLHERRIETQRGKADLSERYTELSATERELHNLASELDWRVATADALIHRLPARPQIGALRGLLGQRGGLSEAVSNGERNLEEAQAQHVRLQGHQEATADAADTARLGAVIRSIRESGDLAGRLNIAQQKDKEAQRLVNHRLESMHPSIQNEKDAATMRVPARAEVEHYRGLFQEHDLQTRETRQKIETGGRDLSRAREAYQKAARAGDVVPDETLLAKRNERNELWERVKLRFVKSTSISGDEAHANIDSLLDLPKAFEQAMSSADLLADRRFDNAEATARLAEQSRAIAKLKDDLAGLHVRKETLVREGGCLESEWRTLWASLPFDPLAPDAMLEWLDKRRDLLEDIDRRAEAETALKLRSEEVRCAKQALLAELKALAIDCAFLENDTLPVILERADHIRQEHEQKAQNKSRLQEGLQDSQAAVDRCKRSHVRAQNAWSEWDGQWSKALSDIGFVADSSPDAVASRLDIIDQMREKAVRIKDLRHQRIEMIERSIADFESAVDEFVQETGMDLSGRRAEEAVLEIERRLEEAKRIRDDQVRKREKADELEKQIAMMHEDCRQARESARHLMEAASVDTMDDLERAIGRSDKVLSLRRDLATTLTTLQQEGDGLSVDQLVEECSGIDIDQLAAEEETMTRKLNALREQLTVEAENRSRARDAFQAIDGNDAAAQAEAARQEALAEMRGVAERYIRVRTSAMLLQWAINRYRQGNQAPLLNRASRLFETLTGKAFSALQVDYDDRDRPKLVGLRPDGQAVPVSGMSTGTADQLFLALRLASIEDYLDRADALPFIADDLFINFDDDRAAAGFAVLGELAQRTQVLFFTHHKHLVDIALRSLGKSLSVVNLGAA